MAAHYDPGHTPFPSGKTPKEGGEYPVPQTAEPNIPPVMPEACFQHDPEAEPRPPSRGETIRDLPHGHRSPQVPALRDSRF